FDAILLKKLAEGPFKRSAAQHGRLARNQKDSILCHETEDSINVTLCGCGMPKCDKVTNCLCVVAHANSFDAQQDQVNRPAASDAREKERPLPAGPAERTVSYRALRTRLRLKYPDALYTSTGLTFDEINSSRSDA